MERTSVAGILVTGLVAAALVAGCSSGDSQALRVAGEDPSSTFGTAIPDSGESVTLGSIPVCVSNGEDATITAVSAVDGVNLEVVDFATADGRTEMFGEAVIDLRGAGFDPASVTVTARCPNDRTELALELKRDSTTAGTGEGFCVQYEMASGSGEMEVPFLVRLCPGEVLDYGCAPA